MEVMLIQEVHSSSPDISVGSWKKDRGRGVGGRTTTEFTDEGGRPFISPSYRAGLGQVNDTDSQTRVPDSLIADTGPRNTVPASHLCP